MNSRQLEKHCAEPWVSHLQSGVKQVEGRLKKGDFAELQAGDQVTWFDGDKRVPTRIVCIREYPSFLSYLSGEGVSNVLPGVDTIEKGLEIYYQYFTEQDRSMYPVLAIQVERL